MQRNSINQDNDRIGSNGYRQMNQGYDRDQQRGHGMTDDDDRYGSNRSVGGYDDNQWNDERHPHDEHERGRWGTDHEGSRGHRYQGGMIDDRDRYRRDEAEFQRSGYASHGVYDRNRTGSREWRGDRHRLHHEEYPTYDRPQYQDRDERGRFNDTGEGRRFTSGYRDDDRYRMDRDDRSRFGSDDTRRYGHPGYGYENQGYGQNQGYGRGGYGRDDRRFDEQRGYGGSVSNDHRTRDDHDRRWTGGGYEEDRRGRGRGRY